MTSKTSPVNRSANNRRRGWNLLKWGACILVLLFVGRRAWQLWERGGLEDIDVHLGWLALAAVVYLAGWLPSVWMWRRLMQAAGHSVSPTAAARAYYCGHLGKYVPGKAMVLVIRAALVKDRGCPPGLAALTVVYETLLMMTAGTVIAIALSPTLVVDSETRWPLWLQPMAEVPFVSVLFAITALMVASPALSPLLTFLARRMTPADLSSDRPPIRIGTTLIAGGWLAFACGWVLHGLSLGLVLRSLGERTFAWSELPMWISATASATVAGFVALFAPGGLGVREGILMETLRIQPEIGEKQAVVAAVLLRAVSLVAEITLAALLYYGIRPARSSQADTERLG